VPFGATAITETSPSQSGFQRMTDPLLAPTAASPARFSPPTLSNEPARYTAPPSGSGATTVTSSFGLGSHGVAFPAVVIAAALLRVFPEMRWKKPATYTASPC
jgi:hypothetical protein